MKSNPSIQSTKLTRLVFPGAGENLHKNIEAILRGDEKALRSLPVKWDKTEDPVATAFDLLMRQPAEFHAKQLPLYEQLFQEAFTAKTPEGDGLLADIMAIVALHRTGLSIPFIEEKIRASQGDPSMELRLLLLEIKMKEAKPDFNPEAWSAIDPEKPHFIVASIYVNMRSKPVLALDIMWEQGQDNRFDLGEPLKSFTANYVAVAIYHYLLTPGHGEEFVKNYLAVRSPWVKAVLDESLDRPALQVIWNDKLEPIRQKLVKLEIENQDLPKQNGGGQSIHAAALSDESNQKIASVVDLLNKLSLQLDSLTQEEYEALQKLSLPEQISELLSRPIPSADSDEKRPANTTSNYKTGVSQSAELISQVQRWGAAIMRTVQYTDFVQRTENRYDFQNRILETKKERWISFSSEQEIFDSIKNGLNPENLGNQLKSFSPFES